jgi:hypothetical protein
MRALILMIALFKQSSENQMSVSELAWRGVFGLTGVAGGVGLSLADIEARMRIASLAIGMLIGVATLFTMLPSIIRVFLTIVAAIRNWRDEQ